MMGEYDLISDSYSMELMLALVAERVWGRIQAYLKERDARNEEILAANTKEMNEASQNKQLSDIGSTLAAIQGKQEFFQDYLNKKM